MERAEQPHISEQFDRYLRTYNDTATWLAETLDGSMMTPFEYSYRNGVLYASDGSAIGPIFHDAERDAIRLAAENPRLQFELRRRRLESGEYTDMLKMVRGEAPNTMIVVSDFPPELMQATHDIGGYNVARKQTMLRILTWDGKKLGMYSQSLDGSDRPALEQIYHAYGLKPAAGELLGQRIHVDHEPGELPYVVSRLTGVYDRSLAEQYGGEWYAGRQEPRRDTYRFVLSQHQLLDHFASRFMSRTPTEIDRYNIAALMRERFEAFGVPEISINEAAIVFAQMQPYAIEEQLLRAGETARSEGRTFSGCGVSVGTSQSPDGQLQAAGYGNTSELEDRFGSLTFTCTKGHTNTRPYGKLIPSCRRCGEDISCREPVKSKRRTVLFPLKPLFGIETSYTAPSPTKEEGPKDSKDHINRPARALFALAA